MGYFLAILIPVAFVIAGLWMISLDRSSLYSWLVTTGAIIAALSSCRELVSTLGFDLYFLPNWQFSLLIQAIGNLVLAAGLIGFAIRFSRQAKQPQSPKR